MLLGLITCTLKMILKIMSNQNMDLHVNVVIYYYITFGTCTELDKSNFMLAFLM